jgi:hypothetical protein
MSTELELSMYTLENTVFHLLRRRYAALAPSVPLLSFEQGSQIRAFYAYRVAQQPRSGAQGTVVPSFIRTYRSCLGDD